MVVKQATKGAKQILQENSETLIWYRNITICTNIFQLLGLYFHEISTLKLIIYALATVASGSAYKMMEFVAKPKFGLNDQILSSGVDLALNGSIGDFMKDIILLTAVCQILSVFSFYFWWFWILAPIGAAWKLYKDLLQPYFFQNSPNSNEYQTQNDTDKKQKKLERKMRRLQGSQRN